MGESSEVHYLGFIAHQLGPLYMRVKGLGSNEIEQTHWLRAINRPLDEVEDHKVTNQG